MIYILADLPASDNLRLRVRYRSCYQKKIMNKYHVGAIRVIRSIPKEIAPTYKSIAYLAEVENNKSQSDRFTNYQQATRWVVKLAFTLEEGRQLC
ncbi:MAG: hypothetical protein F6K17_24160 [Okeania sp. SIO3C4]|nr:hypothetical protein [Okeania sp. SIO3C4]